MYKKHNKTVIPKMKTKRQEEVKKEEKKRKEKKRREKGFAWNRTRDLQCTGPMLHH